MATAALRWQGQSGAMAATPARHFSSVGEGFGPPSTLLSSIGLAAAGKQRVRRSITRLHVMQVITRNAGAGDFIPEIRLQSGRRTRCRGNEGEVETRDTLADR